MHSLNFIDIAKRTLLTKSGDADKKTEKTNSENSKKYIEKVIKNALFIIFLTLFSLIFLSLEFFILSNIYSRDYERKTYITVEGGEYKFGESFPLNIMIENISTPINAAQVEIVFNPNIIQVTEISTTDSFIKIFLQKEVDNKNGKILISGGLPNPGFTGIKAKVSTVLFIPQKEGDANIEVSPNSMVLANDGKGTNILWGANTKATKINKNTIIDSDLSNTEIKLRETTLSNYSDFSKDITKLSKESADFFVNCSTFLRSYDCLTVTPWYNIFKGILKK
jgi:hypothetical protein